ncbi:unnamed protein product [Caenorhabditis angaria]|uniref:Uncharacterized protein n=1 Tax=Caenorhabditis angaria TaxID=860376 RepID=A0A9P1IQN1_9PELO|nr:unnamed protein product [Caenorhabditis angaria]
MSASGFDPFEWQKFFFRGLSREEANKLLKESSVTIGTFLLRDSSNPGDFSLSVREFDTGDCVRHYLISEVENEDGSKQVKIAEKQAFPDIPTLLNHFKTRVLDKASLLNAYKKPVIEIMTGKFKFTGERENDLTFEVGEQLEIITKEANDWWEARNALGKTGMVPANYLIPITDERASKGTSQSSISSGAAERLSTTSTSSENMDNIYNPRLPAIAKVLYDRQPNAYDPTQLRLKKGQTLNIIQKLTNGMYKAKTESDGLMGNVPFTYIRFLRPQE